MIALAKLGGPWTLVRGALKVAVCLLASGLLGLSGVRLVASSAKLSASARPPETGATNPGAWPHGDRHVLWRGDMEERSLADWYWPRRLAVGNYGGGEFDSGGAFTAASTDQAHSGSWSAKMTLPSRSGGTRLFRWRELYAHRDTVVSVWLYVPRAYSLTADEDTGRYWNVFQFKSRSSGGKDDPLWFLDVANPSPGQLRLNLVWWDRVLEGPWRGSHGFRRFRQRIADLPLGRWFRLTARLRQSKDFDGLLCVWQGRTLLFRLTSIRTSYANCTQNAWCTVNEWSVNNYSDGLSPTPAVIYSDDAEIATPTGPGRCS